MKHITLAAGALTLLATGPVVLLLTRPKKNQPHLNARTTRQAPAEFHPWSSAAIWAHFI